ncbi:MAG: hypothetical protein KGL42_04310 [Betaproteobacteria bacterium]|nr:hypothetical protein [Betaproteobacteria bacterium]
MNKYSIILSFVLLAPLVRSSALAMPLPKLLTGLQAHGDRGLVVDFDRRGIVNAPADLFNETAMRTREASELKDAPMLVYRGDATRAIGVAGGFRSLPQGLRFVASLHSAPPADAAIHLSATDYAGL